MAIKNSKFRNIKHDAIEKLAQEVKSAREQVRQGEVYSQEEIMKEFPASEIEPFFESPHVKPLLYAIFRSRNESLGSIPPKYMAIFSGI